MVADEGPLIIRGQLIAVCMLMTPILGQPLVVDSAGRFKVPGINLQQRLAIEKGQLHIFCTRETLEQICQHLIYMQCKAA